MNQQFEDKAIIEQQRMLKFASKKDNVEVGKLSNKFCPVDCWMLSGASESFVEVKVREQYTSTQIDNWGGAMLEFTKLSRIIEEEYNTPILYFNFFKDCLRIYELNMDPTMYSWELKFLQKNDFTSEKVWKFVANLELKDCIEEVKL